MDEKTVIMTPEKTGTPDAYERWTVRGADGRDMTGASMVTKDTRYGDKWLSTLMVGGVGTDPEYRRRGHVRRILETAFGQAKERGWAVSILHPFSFAYYRKFGYERVADHLILDYPITALGFLPRCDQVERVRSEEQAAEAMRVMNEYSYGRALMPRRESMRYYPLEGQLNAGRTYLHRGEDGSADGYITVSRDQRLDVNHCTDGVLNVKELCYTSLSAMKALMGFIRMFDGECEAVHMDNIAMAPEIDELLRHYTHTRYRLLPDIMARVLDPEAFLRANSYPAQPGAFTLRVTDPYAVAAGAWRVRYGNGVSDVERLPDGAPCGVVCAVEPLARIFYGATELDADGLRYLDGVEAGDGAEDFMRAFPRRRRGIFEHF